jgi:small-conductance mechanosensitive channel
VHTIVGNAKVFLDTIQNFSVNPYRRVDLTATINNAVDHRAAIHLLTRRLTTIPNVLVSPAPDVDVLQFTPAGPLLCVRPYCANPHYWPGLLRHQSNDPRELRRGRLPGARAGVRSQRRIRGVRKRGREPFLKNSEKTVRDPV